MASKHLEFIRTLPCLICQNPIETEPAHVRFAAAWYGKPITGMGRKSSDRWVVPLCSAHHRIQHDMGEEKFWAGTGINPLWIADVLYKNSGDHEECCEIIEELQK